MAGRVRWAGALLAGLLWLCGPVLAEPPRAGDSYVASIPPSVTNPPPLSPAGETVVPTDPTFRRACLEMIPALRKNILLGNAVSTDTREWGVVLRIDFSMAAAQMQTIGDRINRLVFWRGPGGAPFVLIAVGQPLPPLPP